MHFSSLYLLRFTQRTLARIRVLEPSRRDRLSTCIAELELLEFILTEARMEPPSLFESAVLAAIDDVVRHTEGIIDNLDSGTVHLSEKEGRS